MGPMALLPLRRKSCYGFYGLKNASLSAGYEPANLGANGRSQIKVGKMHRSCITIALSTCLSASNNSRTYELILIKFDTE
jgi:hypothetical protein